MNIMNLLMNTLVPIAQHSDSNFKLCGIDKYHYYNECYVPNDMHVYF